MCLISYRCDSTSEPFLRQAGRLQHKFVEVQVLNERVICWLRRDLRTEDSVALSAASQGGRECAVAFIWDETILGRIDDRQNRRVNYIHQSLQEVDEKLRLNGSALLIRKGNPMQEITKLAGEFKADRVISSEDYEPAAVIRDAKVTSELGSMGVEFELVKDIVVFHREEILSQTESPFRVYSPFARAWRSKFDPSLDARNHEVRLSALVPISELPGPNLSFSLSSLGFDKVELWLDAGEAAGEQRLRSFSEKMTRYGEDRDLPAVKGTSLLSVDFRFGTVSIRAAVRESLKDDNAGAQKWLAELIWRDFYQHILFHFPHVVDSPFQSDYANLRYPGDLAHGDLWRAGQTGYPLIDAAMRCLRATGYMHNRLRMVVASFLTKDLLLDYRLGESWFARELLDYELASNNGGWQWASSVGCDPQPYFRIFNPILQSKKFDPEGEFIRQWVPELRELDSSNIHFPAEAASFDLALAGVELGKTYPYPCVDHAVQKGLAVQLLEGARRKG